MQMISLKSRILGKCAYYLTRILQKTLTVHCSQDADYNPKAQYLFAFWHGKQLLPVLQLIHHETKRAVLISPSKDGDLLTTWLQKLHYVVIRGSSRRKNISALSNMIRYLKKGYSLGFGIDGPVGPIYKVKPGMTHMAQKLGIPIVPVGSAFSHKWVIHQAWDHYEIPKPFAKARFYLGKPIYIPKDADLTLCNEMLEQVIQLAEKKAQTLL